MKKIFKRSLSFLVSALLICSMAFSLQINTVVAEEADSNDEVSFYENLSEAEFAEDDTITVLIEFDYPENDYDIRETDSLESSQEQLRLLRASNKAYYTENNQEFIDDLDIEYDDMDVSAYSPYVFETFDTWAEYTDARDDLIELSEESKVKRVFAEETPVTEAESASDGSRNSSANIPLNTAMQMIGIKDENGRNISTASGVGIRIGIFDLGYPHDLSNFPDGEICGIRDGISSSDHTTPVASIIGGANGIATNAELYFSGRYPTKDSTEWLLDNQVNIINASVGVSFEGYYSGHDAYVDFISRTSFVLYITSSGNHNSAVVGDEFITAAGLGLNVITVGSIDADKTVSNYSCYLVQDGVSKKPTLVAPGTNIVIPNIAEPQGGTSISAPMVTGMAALLMEEFPYTINAPELIAATLINGCEWLPGQTEMWDTYAGAGLVNYANTRNILLEQRFVTDSVVQKEYLIPSLSVDILLEEGKYLTYCLFDLIKPDVYYTFMGGCSVMQNKHIDPNITYYKVCIYSPSGELIHEGTSDNNVIVGKIENVASGGTYRICVYMVGEKKSTAPEFLALAYSGTTHTHSYTHSYAYFKPSGHKSYCSCGEYILDPHIYQPYVDGGQCCIMCGHVIP